MVKPKSRIKLSVSRATFRLPATPQFIAVANKLDSMTPGQKSKWLQKAVLLLHESEEKETVTLSDLFDLVEKMRVEQARQLQQFLSTLAGTTFQGANQQPTEINKPTRKSISLDKMR